MNKTLTKKAATILRNQAIRYGVEKPAINIQESPLNSKREALYLDGDVVSLYWNHDCYGWRFQDELRKAWEGAGIFAEPYTETIFDIYKS